MSDSPVPEPATAVAWREAPLPHPLPALPVPRAALAVDRFRSACRVTAEAPVAEFLDRLVRLPIRSGITVPDGVGVQLKCNL